MIPTPRFITVAYGADGLRVRRVRQVRAGQEQNVWVTDVHPAWQWGPWWRQLEKEIGWIKTAQVTYQEKKRHAAAKEE